MCGLCYARNLKGQPARDMVLQQFERQRSRGTSGFGFVANTGTPMLRKRTTEADIKKELKKCDAPEILFHHRIPTSTDNVTNACHPFKVKGIKSKHWYYLIHNGILQNHEELKADHEKLGIKYKSIQPDGRFNDSEALANDVMLYLEGEQDNIKARGTIAFICQEFDENSVAIKLHFARNSGNPLRAKFKSGQSFQIASEGPWPEVKQDVHYTFDYATEEITEKELDIKRAIYPARSYDCHDADDRYYHGYRTRPQISWKKEYKWEFKDNSDYETGFQNAYDLEDASRLDLAECYFEMGENEYEIASLSEEYKKEKDNVLSADILDQMKDVKGQLLSNQGFIDGINCNLREKYEKNQALTLPF